MQPSTQRIHPFMNSQYSTFPHLWKPQFMGVLFIVRAPQAIQALDENSYLELMQTRLSHMIAQWQTATSPEATQRLLATALRQLDSAQEIPLLEDDLSEWRQAWAETWITSNGRFRERLRHYGVSFPVTPITPIHPDYTDWQSLHDETALEEWLTELIA